MKKLSLALALLLVSGVVMARGGHASTGHVASHVTTHVATHNKITMLHIVAAHRVKKIK